MGLSTSAETPEVTTTDKVPLTEEKTSMVEEKVSKADEKTSKSEEKTSTESEEKPSEVMEATTTLPTLSSFGTDTCCHEGLAR